MKWQWPAFVILLSVCLWDINLGRAQSVNVTAQVPGVCGNGIVEWGEQCDGVNLNGRTCVNQGFGGGTISCNADCTFNTTLCTPLLPTAPTGGGGGGGGTGGKAVGVPPAILPASAAANKASQAALGAVDLNHNGRVGIDDLSIELFYYGQSGPGVARYDFDHDGKVDIVDISILLYYWTDV